MKNKGKKFLVVLLFISIMLVCACGSSNYKYSESAASAPSYYSAGISTEEMSYDTYGFEDAVEYNEAGSTELTSEKVNDTARKLIKTYNMDVETEDFDGILNAIDERVKALNGYVQNLDTYNGSYYKSYKSSRYSNMTLRIPSSNLDKFVSFIGEAANVTNKTLSVEDVTLSYVDTQAKKETYVIEQERLLALLEKADSIEDMITIESRLSEVRYKLESQESQLRTYDNLVDYSTVYLSVSEVEKYTAPEPVSYWEEVSQSFTEGVLEVWDGLKNFFVGFVGALPSLVVFAIIVVIVVFIVKAIVKGNKKKAIKKGSLTAEDKMNAAKLNSEKKANGNAE